MEKISIKEKMLLQLYLHTQGYKYSNGEVKDGFLIDNELLEKICAEAILKNDRLFNTVFIPGVLKYDDAFNQLIIYM